MMVEYCSQSSTYSKKLHVFGPIQGENEIDHVSFFPKLVYLHYKKLKIKKRQA